MNDARKIIGAASNLAAERNFDLCRVTKSKQAVDLAPNTIRSYASEGLALYRMGRAVFFSKTELAAHIRARALSFKVGTIVPR